MYYGQAKENRDIHQTVPDHRVQLTPEGWKQAEEAGKKLRSLLRPSDTLHVFTSPYRRTRETTEGILTTLTADSPEPSPFPRHTIRVYEEPRLREQDFGNFQPDAAEMSRMWQERADYGHFFYRIPNGESAADAYDRVSGFNESLWRSFGEDTFASVCVLVTHGLMTRVFLMKWYHFSVEYFEDLRNVDHCEFVVMKLNDNGKYDLQNNLRTWSELQRERAYNRAGVEPRSPVPTRTRWDGYQKGDSGDDFVNRQEIRRQNTADLFAEDDQRANALKRTDRDIKEPSKAEGDFPKGGEEASKAKDRDMSLHSNGINFELGSREASRPIISPHQRELMRVGRDGGGSRSGIATPARSDSEGSEAEVTEYIKSLPVRGSLSLALSGELSTDGKVKERIRADALGDQSDAEDDEENAMNLQRSARAPTSGGQL